MKAFRQCGVAVGGSPLGSQGQGSTGVPCVGLAWRYKTEEALGTVSAESAGSPDYF
jgi:hypothetical protein